MPHSEDGYQPTDDTFEALTRALDIMVMEQGEPALKDMLSIHPDKDHILYYDDDLIFVNKPSNIQTVPGFHDSTYSLANIIQKQLNTPHPK